MDDLYTKFMEIVMPILQENWQLAMIGVGVLFLLGAIFRWKWVCDPQGDNVMGFNAFIYRSFGEKGYRVLKGFVGTVIIILSIVM